MQLDVRHRKTKLQQLQRDWVHFADAKEPDWQQFLSPSDRSSVSLAMLEFVRYCKAAYAGLFYQPLDDVAQYYGEAIAFYFAWLAFYTRWLVIPSAIGFICFCLQIGAFVLPASIPPARHLTCLLACALPCCRAIAVGPSGATILWRLHDVMGKLHAHLLAPKASRLSLSLGHVAFRGRRQRPARKKEDANLDARS